MSSALKLISLETANMGRPLFYYKSFHKKGNNYYTRDNNNVEVAFKLLHDPEYGSEKNIKQVLHIVNREISRLFYPSILFYCDK